MCVCCVCFVGLGVFVCVFVCARFCASVFLVGACGAFDFFPLESLKNHQSLLRLLATQRKRKGPKAQRRKGAATETTRNSTKAQRRKGAKAQRRKGAKAQRKRFDFFSWD